MTYTITFALHSRRVCAAVARSFSSMITNVPRVRCNFSGVWKIDASTPRLFLQTSRTLSCKSHKCVNTTVFTYVKNSFLQITQMCHHDCFCICQELFPANHTNVNTRTVFAYVKNSFLQITQMSTPGLFLQMSRTISCKSYRCVKTTSVLTNDRSSFLQIRCIKFDMEKEFQLLTSYFSRSVSTLLVCCHKSNPLK